jgi:hypothetical protein
MSIDFTNDDEKKLLVPRPQLKLITGGKGPPKNPTWLLELEEGDIFLARHQDKAERNFELNMFEVLLKMSRSVKLKVHLGEHERMIRWVVPEVFSREMIFQEVIGNANIEVPEVTDE